MGVSDRTLFVNCFEEQLGVVGVRFTSKKAEPIVLSLDITIDCEEGEVVIVQPGSTWNHLDSVDRKVAALLLPFTDDDATARFLVILTSVGVVQGNKVGLHKDDEGGALACDSKLTPC